MKAWYLIGNPVQLFQTCAFIWGGRSGGIQERVSMWALNKPYAAVVYGTHLHQLQLLGLFKVLFGVRIGVRDVGSVAKYGKYQSYISPHQAKGAFQDCQNRCRYRRCLGNHCFQNEIGHVMSDLDLPV